MKRWFVREEMPEGGGIDIGPPIDGVGYPIRITFNGGESEEMARLIAAAPTLLSACETLRRELAGSAFDAEYIKVGELLTVLDIAIAEALED